MGNPKSSGAKGRGGGGRSRGGDAEAKKPMSCSQGPTTVDYCIVSDFEADDFIAILMLVGNIPATKPATKSEKKSATIHIHISGSKVAPHDKWYIDHANSLVKFCNIINSVTSQVEFSLSCAMDLDVTYNDKGKIKIPNPIRSKYLFLIGPMYDMGIQCVYDNNKPCNLITGENVYAYFGYNAPQMYVNQARFINGGNYANIFDYPSEEDEKIKTWTSSDFNQSSTDWLKSKLGKKINDNTIHCYLKPTPENPKNGTETVQDFENVGGPFIQQHLSNSIFEPFVTELKKAETHEPGTFIEHWTKMPDKFKGLWKSKIIEPILKLNLDIETRTKVNSLLNDIQKIDKQADALLVNQLFYGTHKQIYEEINTNLYSQVPINPGWADSFPIVGFLKTTDPDKPYFANNFQYHQQPIFVTNLRKYLSSAITNLSPPKATGGKGGSAWMNHVRTVYRERLGSTAPLTWIQAVKAAKNTYSNK